MPEALLTVGGRVYGGWTQVRVSRGIEQVSGAFELTLSERWPGQETPWPILPGEACRLSLDNEVVITGWVDDALPGFDDRDHRLRVIGRDATGDLVDCSAANTPGRWENRALTQIVADVCRPFGIPVTAVVDVGAPFAARALQPGESAFEFIETLCRFRGVLPVSDGRGGLVLTGPGTERVPVALEQGVNILAAQGLLSWRERFSRYIVMGCDAGSDDSTPEHNAEPFGEATDPGVSRYRPLIVIADGPGDSAQLATRARWEAAVRRGRAARAGITVAGWRHPGGLWRPNTLVRVRAPWLHLEGDMLIAAAYYSMDDRRGTTTDLELARPEGFLPLAVSEDDEEGYPNG